MISTSKTQLAIALCAIAASLTACSGRALGRHGARESIQQRKDLLTASPAPPAAERNPAWEKGHVLTFGPSTTHGSLGGIVLDAETQSVISVTVTAEGTCSGSGCADETSASQVTDDSGEYFFDAYGDVNGEDDVQDVSAGVDQDAVKITFTPEEEGYLPLVVLFHPNYPDTGTDQTFDAVPTYYLCRADAPDTDGDGICDAAELLYGTDPGKVDTDGDYFSDAAELFGMPGVDLGYYGGSALQRDIFLYMDYYTAPMQAALTDVQTAFLDAPPGEPDGPDGIHLNIFWGKAITSDAQVGDFTIEKVDDTGAEYLDWSEFDGIKAASFPDALANVVHYVLFGDLLHSGDYSGYSKGIPGHDLVVTLGQGGSETDQAATLMHELGHNLGLQHGGDEATNYKPNYLSVMNYTYQFDGLYRDGQDGVLDYSRLSIAGLDEAALCEKRDQNNPPCPTSGFTPNPPTTTADLARYRAKFPYKAGQLPGAKTTLVDGGCNGPLDFNNNGTFDPGLVSADLDGYGRGPDNKRPEFQKTVFDAGWNDWVNLKLYGSSEGGGLIGDMVGSVGAVIRIPEPPQIVSPADMPKELSYP